MKNLTKAQKLTICARLFFQDNIEDYEDFRSAKIEFMANPPSDDFIDTLLKMNFKRKRGHKIFINRESGHIATVSVFDGFFKPRTKMTIEEGEKMSAQFVEAVGGDEFANSNPRDVLVSVLAKIGWVEVENDEKTN